MHVKVGKPAKTVATPQLTIKIPRPTAAVALQEPMDAPPPPARLALARALPAVKSVEEPAVSSRRSGRVIKPAHIIMESQQGAVRAELPTSIDGSLMDFVLAC